MMMRLRYFLLGLVFTAGLGITRNLPAQVADTAATAAQAITTAELARHLKALAADSLRGRARSRPALEATARYVAAEFRALGLQPWAWYTPAESTWLKRYPFPGNRRLLDTDLSRIFLSVRLRGEGSGMIVLNERGRRVEQAVTVEFATAARLATDSVADPTRSARPKKMFLVSGRHTAATLPCSQFRRSALLYIPPVGFDSVAQRALIAHLVACAPVLVVAPEDSATFAARRIAAARVPTAFFEEVEDTANERHWAVAVESQAVAWAFHTAGLDLAATWADTIPRVRELPALMADPYLEFTEPAITGDTYGVYVVGWLRGSDSLGGGARSCVVYSASLDGGNLGTAGDGQDPDAGVGALITLARAFTQSGVRPRRSVAFLLTSGTPRNFAGTTAFLRSVDEQKYLLNLTLDGLGDVRNDTLPIAGLTEFIFTRRLRWVTASHPELGFTVVDGGTVLAPTSDHYIFARRGFVTLALGLGRPEARRPGGDAAVRGTEATDRLMRATRFAFYLGHDFANAGAWPTWAPAARAVWQDGVGR